jgi:hypothetical protein
VTLHDVCGLYVVCAHFDHVSVYTDEKEVLVKICFTLIMAIVTYQDLHVFPCVNFCKFLKLFD